MRIGELCQRSGHTKDTIRFYEKSGLLPVDRLGRGFKQYTDWHVVRLLQIKYAKAAGFTLRQIQQELDHWIAGTMTDEQKRLILTAQINRINQSIDELETVRTYLQQKMALLPA